MIDIIARQGQDFTDLDALNAEEAAIHWSETILLEAEFVRFAILIVHLCGHVDYNILCAEVLLDWKTILKLFAASAGCEQYWVNNGEHLIIHVWHDEGTHSSDWKIKVVNWVSFLIEVSRLRVHTLLQSSAHPGNEVSI